MNETGLSSAATTTKPVGKNRNPWAVLLLSIVTIGLYNIYWYYCIFEEMRNWRGQGWSGVIFIVLFLFCGIALIVIPWLIPAYIGRMYEEDGQSKPITGLSGFWILLPIIGPIVWIFKVQNNLNVFWEMKA